MPVSPDRVPSYLKSNEVAELLGVTKQTLLNWLRNGWIDEPERNPLTRYRLWTEKDVGNIRRRLQERRMDRDTPEVSS